MSAAGRGAAAMQAYYAARAPYYDAVYLRPERRADIAFLVEHVPQRFARRSVLEIACGTGYWTQHIAPLATRVVALDNTAEPLAFARLRPGVHDVAFQQLDAYALPDSLGCFDAAFAGLWLSHVPVGARRAFLRGLHARLGAGARVLFVDNSEVQLRDFPIAHIDDEGNTYQERTLRDGSTHRVLKNFPSQGELEALIGPYAGRFDYRRLDNFWLLEYELA